MEEETFRNYIYLSIFFFFSITDIRAVFVFAFRLSTLFPWVFSYVYYPNGLKNYFLFLFESFTPAITNGLSDSRSPQISKTLLCIQADLNNAAIWMVSSRPVISKSSSPCTSPLVTVSRAPITIGISVTSTTFPIALQSTYLFFRFLSILLGGQPGQQSSQFGKFSIFCRLSLGLVVWPKLGDPFVSQNHRRVCASHSPGQILGWAYTICSYDQI